MHVNVQRLEKSTFSLTFLNFFLPRKERGRSINTLAISKDCNDMNERKGISSNEVEKNQLLELCYDSSNTLLD